MLFCTAVFACRHCHDLNYASPYEQPYQRALGCIQKIHVKLGENPASIQFFPRKQKGLSRIGSCLSVSRGLAESGTKWASSEPY